MTGLSVSRCAYKLPMYARSRYDSVRKYGVQTPILRLKDIATLDDTVRVWRINEAQNS